MPFLPFPPQLINRKEWRRRARSKNGTETQTQQKGDETVMVNECVYFEIYFIFKMQISALHVNLIFRNNYSY